MLEIFPGKNCFVNQQMKIYVLCTVPVCCMHTCTLVVGNVTLCDCSTFNLINILCYYDLFVDSNPISVESLL